MYAGGLKIWAAIGKFVAWSLLFPWTKL